MVNEETGFGYEAIELGIKFNMVLGGSWVDCYEEYNYLVQRLPKHSIKR